jgi:hypothetical protein
MKKIILLVGILFLNSSYGLGFAPRSDCYYDPNTIAEVAGLLQAKLSELKNNGIDVEESMAGLRVKYAIKNIENNALSKAVESYKAFAMRAADPEFDRTKDENGNALKLIPTGYGKLRTVLDCIDRGLSTLNLSDKTRAIRLLDGLGLDISYFSRDKGAIRRHNAGTPGDVD